MLSVKQIPNKQTIKNQKTTQGCKQEFDFIESIAALACSYTLAFLYFSPEQSPVMQKRAIPKCLIVHFAMENWYAMVFKLLILALFSLIHQTAVTFVLIACIHEI